MLSAYCLLFQWSTDNEVYASLNQFSVDYKSKWLLIFLAGQKF